MNDVETNLELRYLHPSRAPETLDLRTAPGQTVVWDHVRCLQREDSDSGPEEM